MACNSCVYRYMSMKFGVGILCKIIPLYKWCIGSYNRYLIDGNNKCIHRLLYDTTRVLGVDPHYNNLALWCAVYTGNKIVFKPAHAAHGMAMSNCIIYIIMHLLVLGAVVAGTLRMFNKTLNIQFSTCPLQQSSIISYRQNANECL